MAKRPIQRGDNRDDLELKKFTYDPVNNESFVNINDEGIVNAINNITVTPSGSQIVEGKTLHLSGTGNAINTNIIDVIDVSAYDTIIIHNTGTYNITAQAQFSNDGTNFVAVLGQSLLSAGAASITVSATNTIYKVPVSGRYFRYRITAYTSGTITSNLSISVHDISDFGQRNSAVSGTVSIQAVNAQVTGTGAALNATPIASTAVGQYDVATIAFTGTWNAILTAEGSNDATNWFSVPVQKINDLQALPSFTVTSNGLYRVPLNFNNFRVRVSTYTSGTVSANARISALDSDNLNPRAITEKHTQAQILNTSLLANTEATINCGSEVKYVLVRSRTGKKLKLAYSLGNTATEYITIEKGVVYTDESFYQSLNIYLLCEAAETVEILIKRNI